MNGAKIDAMPDANLGVPGVASGKEVKDETTAQPLPPSPQKSAEDKTLQAVNSGMTTQVGTKGIDVDLKAATLPTSAYTVLMPRAGWSSAMSYLKDLRQKKERPGGKLGKQVGTTCDFTQLDHVRLMQHLLHTKEPQIFAEDPRHVRGDGTDWNLRELSLLGDVSFAVPVTIFDNGAHVGPVVHPVPFAGTLLYTCGALLRPDNTSADWPELVSKGSTLDEQAYFKIYERRLCPCFQYANDCAKKLGRKALITIPGLGCGQFAGRFMGSLGEKLSAVLQKILERHGDKWLNIHVVYFDAFKEGVPRREVIKDTKIVYIEQPLSKSGPNGRCQLCHPRDFQGAVGGKDDDFSSCDLYSFVAWDHVSWPGNDFWVGNRETDDGVKAAATDSMYKLSGMEGRYDAKSKKYMPPEGYNNWRTVLTKNNIRFDLGSLKDDEEPISGEASLEGEWQRQCGKQFKIVLSGGVLSCVGDQTGKVEFKAPRTVEYMGYSGDYDGTVVKFSNGTTWTKLQASIVSPSSLKDDPSVADWKGLDQSQNEAAWENGDSTDSEGEPGLERSTSNPPTPASQEERRVAENGNLYTKAEFIKCFGPDDGEKKWATAPKDPQSGPLIIGSDLMRLPSRSGGYDWIRVSNAQDDRALRKHAALQTKSAWQRGYTLDPEDPKCTVTCNCIDDMIQGTKLIRSSVYKPAASSDEAQSETEIKTLNGFSMKVAMAVAKGGAKVVTINAASAYHVGGGFETGGRHALEESMCVQSTLFLSLERAAKLAKEEHVKPSKVAIRNWIQPPDLTRDQSNKSSGRALSRGGDSDRAVTAGDNAVLTGITHQPEMNSMRCIVDSWDAKAAKWLVILEGGVKAHVHASNLQPVNATNGEALSGPIANGLRKAKANRGHRRNKWLECHIPEDGAIASPSVEVFRGLSDEGYPFLEKPLTLHVVSVAFPNCNPDVRDAPVDRPDGQADYETLLRNKTIAMFAAAKELEAEVVVLPSIGCGVFQNDPLLVGFIVGDVLRSNFRNVFKRVLVVDTEAFGASALSAANGEAPKAPLKPSPSAPTPALVPTPTTPAPAPTQPAQEAGTAVSSALFAKGDKKQIIEFNPRFNGKTCTLKTYDEATGKWTVELSNGQTLRLAEDNMMFPDLV